MPQIPIPPGRLAGMTDFQQRHRFVFLFAGLLLLLLIAPVLEKTTLSREILAVITTFILFSGIYSGLKESKGLFWGLLLLGVINILTTWWEYAFWSLDGALIHYVCLSLFFLIMGVIILRANSPGKPPSTTTSFTAPSPSTCLSPISGG